MMNALPSTSIATRRLYSCRCQHQRGLTLVELMVAMVISLIIMVGVGTLYVSTKRNYLVENAFSRLQENARYATNYMSMIVRNAGYIGCSSGILGTGTMTNTLNFTTDKMLYNFATGVEGYEFTGTGPGQTYPSTQPTSFPAADTNGNDWSAVVNGGTTYYLPSDLSGSGLMAPGSDVLIVRSANDKNVSVVQNNSSGQVFIQNTGQKAGACAGGATMYSGVCPGDILVISNCKNSVVFQATGVQATGGCPAQNPNCVNVTHSAGSNPGNSKVTWGAANPPPTMSFGPGSEVMGISTKAFFVGIPQSGPNKGYPALYVKVGSAAPQELVPGVENMQVLYGIESNNSHVATEYVTAANMGTHGFGDVVSVRISLLLMTSPLNNHPLDTKLYPMDGVWTSGLKSAVQIYPVKDRRLRKVITFTVKLRNRSVSL